MSVMNVRMFVNGRLQLRAPAALEHAAAVPSTPPKENNPSNEACTPAKTELISVDESAKSAFDDLVKLNAFVVISLPNCPQCEELGAFLANRGVPKTVFVKWDKGRVEYPALKAALSVHAGSSFSFPQVFADGAYQGGYQDVIAKADVGAYDDLFEREFQVKPTTVQRWVERRPMIVFSLPSCPQCDVLYTKLEERGLPAHDIFMKWDKADPRYPSLKAQLIGLIGRSQFTFPQTFVQSSYEGSFDEVLAKMEAGQLNKFFTESFGVEPPIAPVPAAPQEMAFDDDF